MTGGADLAALRREYSAFLRPGRILLTGHSHQAWPDAARAALGACFDDAARYVDDKWERAVFPLVDQVGREILGRLGFDEGDAIAFGRSTQELVSRLLSALPFDRKLRIVTTTGEFHSLRRLLLRLSEDRAEVTWIDREPTSSLVSRLVGAVQPGTDLVAVSAVLFEDATVLGDVERVVRRAAEVSAIPLVDAYHAFDVVPIGWGPAKDAAFVVGGGYKYAQFGEGLCFLRVPPGSSLRPADTGWFADFAHLASPAATVEYGAGGARFAGSTFDPTPFYRARAALEVFGRFGLDVATLRRTSLAQTGRILGALRGRIEIATPEEPERRGGFVAVRVPGAAAVVSALRARGVFVDARGDLLRLGPAPYLTDDEIDEGCAALLEVVAARR